MKSQKYGDWKYENELMNRFIGYSYILISMIDELSIHDVLESV